MADRYKHINRFQAYLMPPSVEDWLEEGHLARFVVEIVESLDLSEIHKAYGGKGGSEAYPPEMLLSLLFYGYATDVFSSRKIERATYDSVAFRYIAANTHPDHDTIATFRRRFLPQLEGLFLQILMIAKESGVLKVGRVSLDGTKIKANASKHKALSWAYAKKLEAQLQKEVNELMRKADAADHQEADDGIDLPREIAIREERLARIREAKATIEARARERYERERAEYEEKMRKRSLKEKKGKKPGGRAPKEPTPGPRDKDQVNLTDEESRIMPLSGGGFGQCYNAQASAEETSRLITHRHLTQNVNDKQELFPTLSWYRKYPELKPQEALVSDNGYYSQKNVSACVDAGITPYISPGRERHHPGLEERFKTPDPLPEEPTEVGKMIYRIQTREGKAIYARRKGVIEPIFGIIKQVMGFRQFLLRGVEKVRGEWSLVCLGYNLKRLHTLMG